MAERAKPVTVEDCDKIVLQYWRALRDDPKANPEKCRERIDLWLDTRLAIMRQGEAEVILDAVGDQAA